MPMIDPVEHAMHRDLAPADLRDGFEGRVPRTHSGIAVRRAQIARELELARLRAAIYARPLVVHGECGKPPSECDCPASLQRPMRCRIERTGAA